MKRSKAFPSRKRKPSKQNLNYCVIKSPVGKLLLAGDQEGLKFISFQDGKHPKTPDPLWAYDEKPFRQAIKQFKAYFSGDLKTFLLKLAPEGSPFQQQVWQALKKVPYGKTVSYGEIAKAIGKPQASRAVGAANGRNPLSIVVPCHRVIGSTGQLVGYGGGLPIKGLLLNMEERYSSFKRQGIPSPRSSIGMFTEPH